MPYRTPTAPSNRDGKPEAHKISHDNGRRTTESPAQQQDDGRIYKSKTEYSREHSQQVDGEKTSRNATGKQDLDRHGAAER